MLYKILKSLPEEAVRNSSSPPDLVLPLVPMDMRDGFIHLSTKAQVADTLNKYFKDTPKVYILCIDAPDSKDVAIPAQKTGNKYRSLIRWDYVASRNDYFAHLYGDLVNEDIVDIKVLNNPGTGWQF